MVEIHNNSTAATFISDSFISCIKMKFPQGQVTESRNQEVLIGPCHIHTTTGRNNEFKSRTKNAI